MAAPNLTRAEAIRQYEANPTDANFHALLNVHIRELGANGPTFVGDTVALLGQRDYYGWSVLGGSVRALATVSTQSNEESNRPEDGFTNTNTQIKQAKKKKGSPTKKPRTRASDRRNTRRGTLVVTNRPAGPTPEVKTAVQEAIADQRPAENVTEDVSISQLLEKVATAVSNERICTLRQREMILALIARMFSPRALPPFRRWLENLSSHIKIRKEITDENSLIRNTGINLVQWKNFCHALASISEIEIGNARVPGGLAIFESRSNFAAEYADLRNRVGTEIDAHNMVYGVLRPDDPPATSLREVKQSMKKFEQYLLDFVAVVSTPNGTVQELSSRRQKVVRDLRIGNSLRYMSKVASRGAWHMFHDFGLITILINIPSELIRVAFRKLEESFNGIRAMFQPIMDFIIVPLMDGKPVINRLHFSDYSDRALNSNTFKKLETMSNLLSFADEDMPPIAFEAEDDGEFEAGRLFTTAEEEETYTGRRTFPLPQLPFTHVDESDIGSDGEGGEGDEGDEGSSSADVDVDDEWFGREDENGATEGDFEDEDDGEDGDDGAHDDDGQGEDASDTEMT